MITNQRRATSIIICLTKKTSTHGCSDKSSGYGFVIMRQIIETDPNNYFAILLANIHHCTSCKMYYLIILHTSTFRVYLNWESENSYIPNSQYTHKKDHSCLVQMLGWELAAVHRNVVANTVMLKFYDAKNWNFCKKFCLMWECLFSVSGYITDTRSQSQTGKFTNCMFRLCNVLSLYQAHINVCKYILHVRDRQQRKPLSLVHITVYFNF